MYAKIKEMQYNANGLSEIVARGYAENHPEVIFIVVNCRGSHLCAYVTFPDICKLQGEYLLDIDANVEVHGGFTFLGEVGCARDGIEYVGWDYAHLGDFTCSGIAEIDEHHRSEEHVWSVDEVAKQAEEVANAIAAGKYYIEEENVMEENYKAFEEYAEKDAEAVKEAFEELHKEKKSNKLLDILSKAKDKAGVVCGKVKDAVVAEYNRDPRLYKGMMLGAGAAFAGFFIGRHIVKNGMTNHPYERISHAKNGDTILIDFGWLDKKGRQHSWLKLDGSPEDAKALGEHIVAVADGAMDNAINFK